MGRVNKILSRIGKMGKSLKKFTLINCICLTCHWIWEVLAVNVDREQECPECKSYDVKTFLKEY